MLPEAIEAMTTQMAKVGNASSLHTSGRAGRRVVEESRETIAMALGARPSEVLFTSGGTESDNLAIKGLFWARRDVDPRRVRLLVSVVEHHAVLDCVDFLEAHEGAKVTWLEVDHVGRVHPETVRTAIEADPDSVALVSVMWANNEVGTVQPIAEIAAVAHTFDIPVHSDAVQAVGQVEVDFAKSGLDLMSVSGHKVGGPQGVGALLVRRDATLVPLSHGGGQERQLRSGTLDTPAIRGFAVAVQHATANRAFRVMRTCSFPAVTVTPSSICWTPRASSAPPAPPARPAFPSPVTFYWPWPCRNNRPVARCGSRSDTPPPPRTSTRSWRRCRLRSSGRKGHRWRRARARSRGADACCGRHERRRRLRGGCVAHARGGTPGRRRASGAESERRHSSRERARLLHHRGRGGRSTRGGHARDSVLRLGHGRAIHPRRG